MTKTQNIKDVFIIGGGVNGCGIARDAIGRGLSVTLADMGDLGGATSSASTKLFHGGLRYLEFFEFRLVRSALKEREVLLGAMPHISWPMRFVLPYHRDMRFEAETPTARLLSFVMPWMRGRRPAWLLRFGLFLYDTLGGRKILPATRTLDLRGSPEGAPLQDKFLKAFEYSDCWIEDARLVALNARDARDRGAEILTHTKVIRAARENDLWVLTTSDGQKHFARTIVNASGPWVAKVLKGTLQQESTDTVRLVRGSHIVTRKLFDHGKCYFFQGTDGRIIFAIPYETDFTLIGTTDADHPDPSTLPVCTPEEADYLCRFASGYFKKPVTPDDIVWTYSGVRPLYDDGATSATAATRDYVLQYDTSGAPLLNVFGGKITTYRKLSEKAVTQIAGHTAPWTAGVPLPGGDFSVHGVQQLIDDLRADYPFLSDRWATRLVKAYGTDARLLLGDARNMDALGRDFGADLTEREVLWLMKHEFAASAEDVVWRRSKLGLRLDARQIAALQDWMTRTATT